MKKILLLVIFLVLVAMSYWVRISFINTHDYSFPTDSHEYGSIDINAAIKSIYDGHGDFRVMLGKIFQSLDTHSAPLYMLYSTFSDFFFDNGQMVNAILSSLFVGILFVISVRLFPLWIAVFITSLAIIYTPLFSLIYSQMPESFGGFFVPTFSIISVFLAIKASKSRAFAILTGIFLGLLSLYRMELRWVGIPFILIWYIMQPKMKKKERIISMVLMFSYYAFFAAGWTVLSYLINPHPYFTGKLLILAFYNTFNWSNFGWTFDTAPLSGWGLLDILRYIVLRNPLQLLWLQLAQDIRLWSRPATGYIGEYLISDRLLYPIHYLLIGSALFGLRRAFFDKKFTLLGIILLWGTLFSFAPEELRRQIPLLGIMMLFAGAGLYELSRLMNSKVLLVQLFIIFILNILDPQVIYGIMRTFSWSDNIFFLRILFIFIQLLLLISITKKLYAIDINQKSIFKNIVFKLIPSLIPLIVVGAIISYQLRSPLWHQWDTKLNANSKIEQAITLDQKTIASLKNKDGYLLVDIKDPDSGKYLQVVLNEQKLINTLPLKFSMDPMTRSAIRQLNRKLPRIGWGKIEPSINASSVFPDTHQWLIFLVKGDVLKVNNLITVKNNSISEKNAILVFGDYRSSFNKQEYDGPTARIFTRPTTFYKYQVDGDLRLPEAVRIESKANASKLYVNRQETNDLSTNFGKQTGRYRIFFLFPLKGSDPKNVF